MQADAQSWNAAILDAIEGLPHGRGYRFEPASRAMDPRQNPRDPAHDGVTRDLSRSGVRVARAAPDGATYCCGVTFEAWAHVARARGVWEQLSSDELSAMVEQWFCPTIGHPGVAMALTARGLGVPVPWDEVRPGDLVQYWRRVDLDQPSGHSAVVLEAEGRPERGLLRYLSSQPATQGVGVHAERTESCWQLHFVRAISPTGSP